MKLTVTRAVVIAAMLALHAAATAAEVSRGPEGLQAAAKRCCPVQTLSLCCGDRTRPFRTKLAVNQPYLNAISSPLAQDLLVQQFRELSALATAPAPPSPPPFVCLLGDPSTRDVRPCSERMLRAAPTPHTSTPRGSPPREGRPPVLLPTQPEDLAARWRREEQNAIYADDCRSARHFLSIDRDYPEHPVGQLAVLAAADWQHRVGIDDGPGGAQELFTTLVQQCPWLRHPAQLGLLEVALSRGQYAQVRRDAQRLRGECSEQQVRDWCALRLAQCHEFEGRFVAAAARYAELAKSADKGLAAEAGYAVMGVGELGRGWAWSEGGGGARSPEHEDVLPAPQDRRDGGARSPEHEDVLAALHERRSSGASVRYLGEDRATQGDWFLRYGREAFILCAQQAPQDVAGGTLPGWPVVPTVGNPKETTRYWVTSRSDTHRSLLYNPLMHLRRAANWDDRGEAYPLGTGPDLLLAVPVPAGEHVVSLCFVNDRSYYEPGRVYTISAFDEGRRYQAGAEVRSFVRGVYYRFAVRGPQRVHFRLWRNLAVNLIFGGIFLDRPGRPGPWPAQVPLWAPHKTTVSLPQGALNATGAAPLQRAARP